MLNKKCPECSVAWEGETIPNGLFAAGYYETMEEAREAAKNYGWTPENGKRFGVNVMGIETPQYDGISYWQCMACDTLFDRWTMKKVSSNITHHISKPL